MSQPKRPSKYRLLSICIGAAFAGSAVTLLAGRPTLAMAAVTLISALVGAASRSLRGGLLRGAAVGLAGGLAIVCAVNQVRVQKAIQAGPPKTPPATQVAASRPATSTSRPATRPNWQFKQQWGVTDREATAIAGSTVFMCVAAAGLFAHVAQKRRQMSG